MCMCMSVWVYVSVCMCVWICVRECDCCVCDCVCICVWVLICVTVWVGMCICESICVRMCVCECVCACSQFKTPPIPRKQKKRKGPKASNSFVNKCKNNCQNCSWTSDFELFPSIFPEIHSLPEISCHLFNHLSVWCVCPVQILFFKGKCLGLEIFVPLYLATPSSALKVRLTHTSLSSTRL